MTLLDTATHQLQQSAVPAELHTKWQALIKRLTGLGSVVVAYSGGVDSTFLAYAAYLALGERMIAVTIHSEAESEAQIEQAERLARDAGFPHTSLKYSALQNINFRTNPVDRCYHCKLSILGMLRKYAREYGFDHVVEGQNTDDAGDYRPGRKAVSETETLSPLAECGFSKKDIRQAAKAFGLPVWNLPSSPCLASRFPYGTSITVKGLDQVAKGEEFLHSKGFQEVRVRYHNDLARLEVAPEKMQSLLELRDEVNQYFKSIGFLYVTIDLQGYRQGSLNEGLGL